MMFLKRFLILMWSIASYSCGDNAFQFLDGENPAEDAAKKLEEGKPSEAETICLKELGSAYANIYTSIAVGTDVATAQQAMASEFEAIVAAGKTKKPNALVSILASARAQLHGIDPLTVALVMATGESSTEAGGDNEITALFPALPDPTSSNLHGLNVAIAVLNSLGEDRLTNADRYKLAIFLTSSVSLATKAIDDGDNTISVLEVAEMSDEVAIAILGQLASAALAVSLSAASGDGDKARANAESIAGISAKIAEEPGTSQADQLRSFLSKQSS